jgi:DNA mismatch repair protein MutL
MAQSSVIRILPEAVANKIAAGEVVERPASVVKELMENSVDAGAERVEVAVEAGGKRLVRVVDDGCGMTHDDALLAFERHSTSKIRSAEDLFQISTLGFRGEALPSIAAVSRLELETRHASESSGTRVEVAGGRLRDVKEIAWSRGTRVEVRDLFFNTPARRKFLKSESTELGHIATLVTHYALAHFQKSFRLTSLTNEILNVSPVASARERVYQVMGHQLLEQLVEISPVERRMSAALAAETAEEGEQPEEPVVVRVSGFVSRPEVQKLNRNQIYFFVNRRLVRDRLILHAITEAYRNILPASVFPVALIFLELPASEVDVNVHPSKTEVRFRRAAFLHDLVRDSIRQALVAARPVAAFPLPKAARAPSPDLDEAEAAERISEEPPLLRGAEVHVPRSVPAAPRGTRDFQLSSPRPAPETGTLPLEGAALSVYEPPGPSPPTTVEREGEVAPAGSGVSEFPADLHPLGQVQDSFIVATNAEGLWIIDQHVAHERVLFERHLRQRREKKVEGQRLLLPIIVGLTPQQLAAFQDIAEELDANGFEVEPFGQRTVAVKTSPAEIRADEVERLLLEILESVGREAHGLSLDDLRLKIATSVACHAAIKVNMPLERKKMEWLLRELGRTECPMSCPHGRPIVLRYGLKEIQKAFKRT